MCSGHTTGAYFFTVSPPLWMHRHWRLANLITLGNVSSDKHTPPPHLLQCQKEMKPQEEKGLYPLCLLLFSAFPCSSCSSWAWLQCDILSAPGRKCEEQPLQTSTCPPRAVLPWFGSPLTFCLLEGEIMSKESGCRQLTSRSHKFL